MFYLHTNIFLIFNTNINNIGNNTIIQKSNNNESTKRGNGEKLTSKKKNREPRRRSPTNMKTKPGRTMNHQQDEELERRSNVHASVRLKMKK